MSLRLQQIHVSFRTGPATRQVLVGVDAEFTPGAVTVLVGPNGAGKTTLLRAAMGFLSLRRGQALLDGTPVSEIPRKDRPRRLIFIPQRSEVAFAYTVREVIGMACNAAGEGDSPHASELIGRALTLVQLADRAHDRIGELSAGQQQRITLARAMVQLELAMAVPTGSSPRTIALLADEPVSAMDLRHAIQTLAVFKDAAARGIAVGLILHDLTLAARVADRAIVLSATGEVAASGPASQILTPECLSPVLGVPLTSTRTPDGAMLVGPATAPEIP